MNSVDKLAKAILNSKADKGTKPYDTEAVVTMIDGDTAYVHIPDGVAETPAKMVVNAKEGDSVRVRVAGGRAYVTGNATAPPTDDTTALKAESAASRASRAANIADMKAEAASKAADSATKDAAIAHEAAYSAIADAGRAREAAESAQADADIAKASARDANEYATRALSGLSTVQSVAETLTWITQHGTMTLTTDTEIDPSHVYFVQDNDGDYVVGNVHYSLVIEPDVADISTYYELTIDESLNNYVGTHLALTGEGLWLLPATSGTNKILIATGAGTTYTSAGTYIIDSTGTSVAKFGAESRIGAQSTYNVLTDTTGIAFREGSAEKFKINAETVGYYNVANLESKSTYSAVKYESTVANDAIANGFGNSLIESSDPNDATAPRSSISLRRTSDEAQVELISAYSDSVYSRLFLSTGDVSASRYAVLSSPEVDIDADVITIALNTSAQSGTDHDLYQAIVALGWKNDVIV